MGRLPLRPHQPARPARGAVAPPAWLRPLLQPPPRYAHGPLGDAVSFRTAQGGRIDRSRVLRFTFDGRPYTGFAGDTLASALLANGVHLAGRSFKYHRPRGIM